MTIVEEADLGHSMYELTAGPYEAGQLRVALFKGREEVNALYRFDVHFRCMLSGDFAIESQLLRTPARLVLRWEGGGVRSFEGIVSRVELSGAHRDGGTTGSLRIVPRLARLLHTQNSRVYQDKTVVEIVSEVLDRHGVVSDWQLARSYPRRAYCTQYAESDYAFVTRLLAEEGFFFFFRHPLALPTDPLGSITETLVIADEPAAYPSIQGSALLRCQTMTSGEREASVSTFMFRLRTAPEAVMLREYDYRRPSLDLTWASYPTDQLDGVDWGSARIYEHHGEYESPDLERDVTAVHLDQHRSRFARAWGTSPCRRLAPGHVFTLEHPEMPHRDGPYAALRVDHDGYSPWTPHEGIPDYSAIYTAVPAGLACRPPRPRRVPRQVVEQALVVGAAGEEVHTDNLGRVKVQFHWDREGARDERSSCFLRVVQPWAGAGFGFQFLPRVGTEVLVGFIAGDLDNPVVLGGLYNAVNPPPIPLPMSKTQSLIRSRSTPGGMGYNEIVFDDDAGAERLLIRAERDLGETVRGSRTADVGGDDTLRLAGHQSVSIHGEQRIGVDGAQVLRVQGDQTVFVGKDRMDSVVGDDRRTVGKDLTTQVQGSEMHGVGGDLSTSIGGMSIALIQGTAVTVVGGESPSSWSLHAQGTANLHGEGAVTIDSTKEVILRCGKSSVRLTPEAIELVAPEVRLRAPGASVRLREGEVEILAKERASMKSEKVLVRSAGARVLLGDDANIDGKAVKIACDPGPNDDTFPEDEAKPTRVELFDTKGRPIPYQRYVIELEDGTSAAGMVGEDGTDDIVLEQSGNITFPELSGVKRDS